jgi:drug/metabolite transporter (DMT)-like permease
MWAVLALGATVLTSILPIFNKQLLRNAHPALVAWTVNIASLPILAIGTFFLTQCAVAGLPERVSLTCTTRVPQIDTAFVVGIFGSAILNWAATLLSSYALSRADASLVTPLLTFNPAFTLLLGWIVLREAPGLQEGFGIAIILCGAYLLEVQEVRSGFLAPLFTLIRRPGAALAVVASALWGTTTVLEKLAIDHVTPSSGSLVAFTGTTITVILLTPQALAVMSRRDDTASSKDTPTQQVPLWGLGSHPRAFLATALLAGIAPLFGFTAIALGLVGNVTALFKLSAVFTVLWAWLFLHEGNMRTRLLGVMVMVLGGALVAT